MPNTTESTDFLKGGEYLIKDSTPQDIFIPEDVNEEQRMMRDMVKDFVNNEIMPVIDRLETLEKGLAPSLLEKMGELGLLGTHMPEAYGGMQMDEVSNSIVTEEFGTSGAIVVSIAVQTGIGMLPTLYFGTEEQKNEYLPKLISAELKAAYCLTEPSAGSDALSGKTQAVLTEDGKHYIINGQKMWISNAGFADIFTVFAQVDGDKFTGFLVPRDAEGVSLGEEEKKMGIKGSSTRMVFFENVKVPVENLLGEVGKGHLIAFNALNIGRFKLCVMSIGGAKGSIGKAVKYANERHQFKQPISNFGAIKHKLGEQLVRVFATESAQYRTADLLEKAKKSYLAEGASFGDAKLKAAEEYAIECALLKVAGSEVLDFVVDETLQIHGGMGFSEEGSIARNYRDSRINRIYEGTNEINRLLSVDMLLKRALKGKIDLIGPAWAVQKELAGMPSFDKPEGKYGEEIKAVKDFKKLLLMVAGGAAKMQMDGELDLKNEQEILMNTSDMMIRIFEAESTLLRVMKLNDKEDKHISQDVYDAILKVYISESTSLIQKYAKDALTGFAEGDLLRTFLMGLKRFTKYPPSNIIKMRRLIADTLIEANDYCFG